jgi:disulfide oxidoreductase YuzD
MTRIVTFGKEDTKDLINALLKRGCGFTFNPMPNDLFEVNYNDNDPQYIERLRRRYAATVKVIQSFLRWNQTHYLTRDKLSTCLLCEEDFPIHSLVVHGLEYVCVDCLNEPHESDMVICDICGSEQDLTKVGLNTVCVLCL